MGDSIEAKRAELSRVTGELAVLYMIPGLELPPESLWRFWIEKATASNLRIFYSWRYAEIVEWDSLGESDRGFYYDLYTQAEPGTLPDPEVIAAVVQVCQGNLTAFSLPAFSGELLENPRERIEELERRKLELEKGLGIR